MQQEYSPSGLLPRPAVRRFPLYLREIEDCMERGEEFISGALLADVLGLDRVLVRKDLALTGVSGTPRLGFPVRELSTAIHSVLGWDTTTKAVLVGAGNLGSALLGYGGFREYGLQIILAFDKDPMLCGRKVNDISIEPMDKLEPLVREKKVEIAILTVPGNAAQCCAEALAKAGIRGIWNFSPAKLTLPPEITVQHENLASSLAVLSHAIATGIR